MKLKRFLAFVIAILLCFSMCACGEEETANTTSSQQSNTETVKKPTRFTVTVADQNGNLIEGVVLKLEKNSTVTARSNNQGVATFPPVNTDGYKLYVLSCPQGYYYDGSPVINIKPETGKFLLKIVKK